MEIIEDIQLFVDGGSRGNPGPAASAYIIKNAGGQIIKSDSFYLGHVTTSVAEYNALLQGLDAVHKNDGRELAIFCDSELMVKQIIGEAHIKNMDMLDLFEQVQRKLLNFDRWHIKYILSELNKDTAKLVNNTINENKHKNANPESELAERKKSENKRLAAEACANLLARLESQQTPIDTDQPTPKVMVEVIKESSDNKCSVSMKKGQCFVFTDCVPAGLCVNAALAILPTVAAMQHDPKSSLTNAMDVTCCRTGCNAAFKITML